MSIIDNNAGGAGADEDCDTSTSSADMFKHVIGQCDLRFLAILLCDKFSLVTKI